MDSSGLLQTKLHTPLLRSSLVPRPRLIDRLNAGMDGRLILVSAQAGSGKTTLVAEWLSDLRFAITDFGLKSGDSQIESRKSKIENRFAWLSLDDSDNDPRRFLDYLLAALRQVQADVGRSVEAILRSPQPPPNEVILTALVNEIATIPQPFVLVLDDYHVIHTLPIHQQLNFLIDHQPPQMRMVFITREDPPLPLPRLRARGQLTEIRQTDLRFSPDECADFLQRVMGLNLSSEDIAALERRTEGWIAGLQLAALSMRGHEDVSGFIQAFTGSSRFILDYLIEEVFEGQTPEVKDFLLRTSVLGRMCGALCDAVISEQLSVTSDTDHQSLITGSQEILESLEHSNLFIIPLDQSRQWFRYHRLFAELLHQRLQVTETISISGLHRSASQWFASEGLFPEAIHHALVGADWEQAADLVAEQSVLMLRRGELVTFLDWLKSLPDEVICARPPLCRDYGWALTLTGQLDAAERYLEHAEQAALGDDALLGTVLVARAYNLRVRGDTLQAIERAQRALSLLPQTDSLSRGLVALTLGLAHWTLGSFRESEQAFMEVEQAARQSNNHYARLTALTYLGVIQGIYGHLHRAEELCRRVIELGGESPPVAPAYIELGALLCEWNDLESAGRHLQIGIELSQRTGNVLIQSDGYRTLAILKQACSDSSAALSALNKLDELAGGHEVSPMLRIRNAACHVQIALAQGDLLHAARWAEQVTEEADASLLYPRLGLSSPRLFLAQDKKSAAAKELARLYEIASKAGWGAGMIEVRALQAVTAAKPTDALKFLEDALKMAQPERFIRTFVDKGEPMKFLLERLRAEGGELKDYMLILLSAFGEEKAGGSKDKPLVEAMSERELEILRLMAEGLSNREIAERLVITVGTTKSHVHHILEKLGAESRMQAAAKARELGLV